MIRRRPGRTRSLRARLVLGAVSLIAVVCAVIGTVTAIALRSHLYERLDEALGDVAMRASGPPMSVLEGTRPGPPVTAPLGGARSDALDFVRKGPQELGTIGALLGPDGSVERAVVSEGRADSQDTRATGLGADARAALESVARDGHAHGVTVPGQGDYRVVSAQGVRGSFLVGVPTAGVDSTVRTLVVVEVCVTGAGLIAASLAGTAMVDLALRPLRRVAATAARVSELPLDSGEVALHERVPEAESDPRTEVGRVGASLNRMLDHVHAALDARQRSETRVRRFVADASHELRTPLASILGYAELTRRGHEETGPDTRHALGRIESEARRMTGLVEDLLLLARLDAGRPLSRDRVDLAPLVADAVNDARVAGARHVWRLELPHGPAPVRGDAARLHQVLANLLANARTHTPPGSTVTARLDHQGGRVCLEVRDDGPGIPPDLLPHVFERFARGDTSRSRAAGSTGLGLAIVRAVTAAHGGTVAVDGGPGGAVFTVRLPAAADAGDADSQVDDRLTTPS